MAGLLAGDVLGWGKQGHEIVGNVASALVSYAASSAIAQLLNVTNTSSRECAEECSPLAQVADWADQVRYKYHWSAPLHFIDVRDDMMDAGCPASNHSSCRFLYPRDCPGDMCVAGAIVNYTSRLLLFGDDDDEDVSKRQSLMFLVHFVGDIHQPLHCARQTDRGGNLIHVHYRAAFDDVLSRRFLGSHQSLNLHAIWDDSLIETALALNYNHSRNAFEASLLRYIEQTRSTPKYDEWLRCADAAQTACVASWGEESWEAAAAWAYANVDGTDIADGTVLDESYYASRIPVVRERLAVAGVRLAAAMEQIFGTTSGPTTIEQPLFLVAV